MRRKKRNSQDLPPEGFSRRDFLKGASMAVSTGLMAAPEATRRTAGTFTRRAGAGCRADNPPYKRRSAQLEG